MTSKVSVADDGVDFDSTDQDRAFGLITFGAFGLCSSSQCASHLTGSCGFSLHKAVSAVFKHVSKLLSNCPSLCTAIFSVARQLLLPGRNSLESNEGVSTNVEVQSYTLVVSLWNVVESDSSKFNPRTLANAYAALQICGAKE
jgi:hypothetical protein